MPNFIAGPPLAVALRAICRHHHPRRRTRQLTGGAGLLVLLGVAVVVVGFALRFNPLLVVVAAAFVTGWFAHLTPLQVLAAFGKAFNDNRLVSLAFLTVP